MRIVPVGDVGEFAATARPAAERGVDVADILEDVRLNGDAALARYERRFGGGGPLRISEEAIHRARNQITKEQRDAILAARDNLAEVEMSMHSSLHDITAKMDGATISRRFVPIGSVGCYVPGGLARYPSSAIMSVTTARVAGVRRVVVITPSTADGVDDMTLASADICGADEIYGVGGAHGIAALAYGTKTIRPVDKIVGPGGPYVTAAKAALAGTVPVDMPAGPTELAVLADGSADPSRVAADIVAQAEHSRDSFCCVITTSAGLAAGVQDEVGRIVPEAERREIIDASLSRNGFIAVCESMEDATRLADALAPEHLQVMTESPDRVAAGVRNAGLVLLGHDTPSTASDYLLGTNHILPTGGWGRTRGALSVLDFVKVSTTVSADADTLAGIAGHVRELTASEGLPGHYESVRCRV